MEKSNYSGFTLIELVIIIVILGILAAIAIPKYKDISSDAREAACRGALGALRSGITIFYANQAVQTGYASWPPVDSLITPGIVMEVQIPPNPYCDKNSAPDSIVAGVTRGVVVGTRGGWAYNPTTGEIWPNTDVAGENTW